MMPMIAVTEPSPGSADNSPPTTRFMLGTSVINLSTRSTRKARSTASGPEAGISATATTAKSKTLHGSRKNDSRCAMRRSAISTKKATRIAVSAAISHGPQLAITVELVSSPSITALTNINALRVRWTSSISSRALSRWRQDKDACTTSSTAVSGGFGQRQQWGGGDRADALEVEFTERLTHEQLGCGFAQQGLSGMQQFDRFAVHTGHDFPYGEVDLACRRLAVGLVVEARCDLAEEVLAFLLVYDVAKFTVHPITGHDRAGD